MSWKTIIKESRKDENLRRTKLIGGGTDKDKFGRIKDTKEDTLDYVDEDYEESLADSTKEQILNSFIERLEELSKEELIAILVKTKGNIELKKPIF